MARADLPQPKTGANGKPLNILFLSSGEGLDPEVTKRLAERGYTSQVVSNREPLTLAFLKQFNTVVLVGIENYNGGGYFDPGGSLLDNTEKNVGLLRDYVAEGGGLVVVPQMQGQESASTLQALLEPWKARIPPEVVRDDAHLLDKTYFSWTRAVAPHPVTEGVKALLYPTHIMRWDDNYPASPVVTEDPAWTAVVRGEPGSAAMYGAGNGKWAPGSAGAAPALAAVRYAGKGRVAVVGLGTFYILTHAFENGTHVGESTTGPIDGTAYAKGDGKTPSDWGVLLDNMLRWSAEPSVKAGLVPSTAPWKSPLAWLPWHELPAATVPDWAVLNWKTDKPLTPWSTLPGVPVRWRENYYFDAITDPRVVQPQKMMKVMIGAHSAYSDGKGTVAEWAAAAKAAGYSALVFTERFENFDPAKWTQFVRDCREASVGGITCLQGLDVADAFANRFLLMGNDNFPDPGILTQDGKALKNTERLSLGFARHTVAYHRPGSSPMDADLARHFQAISVYTYGRDVVDGNQGPYRLVDNGFPAYWWEVKSSSNPVPIAVHEMTEPAQIATDGAMGFQVVVPAQDSADAAHYFRAGMSHFFENPPRYYLSEGPVLDRYSIRNSDIGRAELNRQHFRAGLAASAGDDGSTIDDVVLYDGDRIARRWAPKTKSFEESVDGEHAYQHNFLMIVTDSKGRRAISPQMRTVTQGFITRCSDRQNWFGAALPYSGIWPGTHSLSYFQPSLPQPGLNEALRPYGQATAGENLANKLQFPFASNAVTLTDMVVDSRYLEKTQYGMDAWRLLNTVPTRNYTVLARVAKWHDVKPVFTTDNKDYNNTLNELTGVELTLTSRQAVQPETALFPTVQKVLAGSTYVYRQGTAIVEGKLDGKPATLLDLPAGASIGDLLLLAPLTVSGNGDLGWRADTGRVVPRGTQWRAAYTYLPREWRAAFGADGATPWALTLDKGTLASSLGAVNLTAAAYGASGKLKAGGPAKVLPVVVQGLNENWPAALWTPGKHMDGHDAGVTAVPRKMADVPKIPGVLSGDTFLNHIGVFDNIGYASLDNSADTPFFVGNTLTATDPRLKLAYTWWTKTEAGIEVHNPTDAPITAKLSSPAAITDRYKVDTSVTVPPRTTVRVTLPGAAPRVAAINP